MIGDKVVTGMEVGFTIAFLSTVDEDTNRHAF